MEPGIYLTHKPVGETSFSVVRAFMGEAAASPGRRRRVCHGGTLDPFAEGLLVVLVGQATRLMDLHHPIPKLYEAEVAWGVETDTCDPGGRAVFGGCASSLDPALLSRTLLEFVGWREQVPPDTCAKKIGGEPAYRKAHRGEPVRLAPCRVYVHDARWLSHDLPRSSRLRLLCKGGYYVRSLARDMGRALGCGAHLARLSRDAVGPYSDPGTSRRTWVHSVDLLPWCPSRSLSDAEMGAIRRGGPVPYCHVRPPSWDLPEGFPDPGAPVRAFHRDRLAALLCTGAGGGGLAPLMLFPGGL